MFFTSKPPFTTRSSRLNSQSRRAFGGVCRSRGVGAAVGHKRQHLFAQNTVVCIEFATPHAPLMTPSRIGNGADVPTGLSGGGGAGQSRPPARRCSTLSWSTGGAQAGLVLYQIMRSYPVGAPALK